MIDAVTDFLASLYPWTKALHIMAIIAWMAALLYLPRLYVYHTEAPVGSEESERFKVMERRLLRAIANPSMIAAYVFGLSLLFTPGLVDWSEGWLHAKLLGIAVITVMHHYYAVWYKQLSRDERKHSQRLYRIANEVPALAMVLIVIMVVVRPF